MFEGEKKQRREFGIWWERGGGAAIADRFEEDWLARV